MPLLESGTLPTAADVVNTLEQLVEERGAPEYIRSDNGPEPERSGDSLPQAARRANEVRQFIAQAVRDWPESKGMKTLFIEPGAPWQNAFSESFNARFRDDFLNVELFSSVLEAKVLGGEHRHKYNQIKPHSSLEDHTPAEFAARCLAALRPPLRKATKPTPTQNQISHKIWLNYWGHSIPHIST